MSRARTVWRLGGLLPPRQMKHLATSLGAANCIASRALRLLVSVLSFPQPLCLLMRRKGCLRAIVTPPASREAPRGIPHAAIG